MEAVLPSNKKQRYVNFAADVFALNTFCYFISIPIELGFAQMSLATHLHARLIGLFIITSTARPFGIWRDWIFRKCRLTEQNKGMLPYLVDTFAYLSFEMPLYLINLSVSGASSEQMLRSALIFCLISGVVGRPYGIYRSFLRKKIFKIKNNYN
ncbi:L-alanine exporter AlaE [Aeromonas salmonicida]|uniref:L-alanine exporter AlaE n=1 Tax=Aeromonas TaxID=642 RepID=UPI00145A3723|nr:MULTISPECIES: L-alanine exporter AlaE [Aeromonas]ELI6434081.1 L-alanine exporter AlaE [Aeromonas salmonicida subsp. salmonicida]MBS2780238.1 L-alanine exporter AlaE [Aeromonas salmonicida]MCE9935593.1 L-alanine exporter AlaE [Aeromonas salmonicida]MDF2390047.1 L-alanine exporter AlaE [Aeromonas sp. 2MA4]